ncbi:hypothetical protein VCB84_001999 [Providencia rettgeri]|nr:hypothetical protein [Providencia rettgeri]EJD6643089.1 hypothetical protein [Providencia rettgeri]ELL9155553.1 hypothetical protein [Providencia rettgeri]ELR5048845.1 hypothetical protein [Providencia rettgeri]ELR5061651.1 hypothetical protein [Providencia rettgeri]
MEKHPVSGRCTFTTTVDIADFKRDLNFDLVQCGVKEATVNRVHNSIIVVFEEAYGKDDLEVSHIAAKTVTERYNGKYEKIVYQ